MQSLRSLRNLKKLSQSELANLLGVSLRTVQNWEQGKSSMTLDNAQKVALEFDISIQSLVDSDFNDLESINQKIDNKDTGNYVSENKIRFLDTLSTSEIVSYIILREDKFKEDPNYHKFLELKIKDGVIEELMNRLNPTKNTR